MWLTTFVGAILLVSVALGQTVPEHVAFTAGFRANQVIEGGQIIAYNDVFTNHGDCYNNTTGIFTAPKDGLYVFTMKALTIKDKDVWLDLYQNDQYLISAFAKLVDDYAHGANTIALQLVNNDSVYVKTRRTVHIFGETNEVYATFSGFLLESLNNGAGNVAFTAGLKQKQTVYGEHFIEYKDVFTNLGDGYSNDSGIFTAPKDGIYAFHINALTEQNEQIWIDLYHNQDYLISAFGQGKDGYANGENSITLRLTKNDSVYLKAGGTSVFFGDPKEVYATFTGYLVGPLTLEAENVAFTAGLRESQVICKDQIIVYQDILTNCGGSYDGSTGIFTTPKNGLYVFNINALTTKGTDFWIDLYKNDQNMISAFARVKDDHATGGNSIVLQLNENDIVYVKTRREGNVFGRPEQVYTTFSGFLLGLLPPKEVGNVAFTAGFTVNKILQQNEIVAYNEVLTNLGNGYSPCSGVFRAPKDGVYVFHIRGLSAESFWLSLYHNDQYKISASGQKDNGNHSGGNMVVLQLKKSDRVYVKAREVSYLLGQADNVSCTFSGYLIGA